MHQTVKLGICRVTFENIFDIRPYLTHRGFSHQTGAPALFEKESGEQQTGKNRCEPDLTKTGRCSHFVCHSYVCYGNNISLTQSFKPVFEQSLMEWQLKNCVISLANFRL